MGARPRGCPDRRGRATDARGSSNQETTRQFVDLSGQYSPSVATWCEPWRLQVRPRHLQSMRDVERCRIAPSITGTHLNSGPSERRCPWSRKQNDATPRINRSPPTGAPELEQTCSALDRSLVRNSAFLNWPEAGHSVARATRAPRSRNEATGCPLRPSSSPPPAS